MRLFGSETPNGENYLRAASPSECRCIARESLDFYRALVIGGIYEFSAPVDITSVFTYTYALSQCVLRHPQLSVTIAKADTDSPYFVFCPRLDLNQHVQFLEREGDGSEIRTVERVLPSILETKWPPSIPAWKIVILPFSQSRCFIGFSYSHTLGDGISAMGFHRTFLDALQEQRLEKDLICTPRMKKLSPAFDTAENLPISWSYLLSPLLGVYLPKFVSTLFGFHPSASTATPGTWTGSSIFYSPETCRTGVQIISIDAITVHQALKACRIHGAKLTGLIHQFIITALSGLLPQPNNVDNFVGGTALNMRKTVGSSNDEMGLFVSGDYQMYALPKKNSETNEEFSWALANSITDRLTIAANNLHDQPIGLLRFLPSIRSWTLSKLGQPRDSSYEISNLISFQPLGPVKRCSVTEMVFCQPTSVMSSPLTFSVISTANGPLNISVNWQIGALDLGLEETEVEFVSSVCQEIRQSFSRLCCTSEC